LESRLSGGKLNTLPSSHFERSREVVFLLLRSKCFVKVQDFDKVLKISQQQTAKTNSNKRHAGSIFLVIVNG
jgi:hypothetical protein